MIHIAIIEFISSLFSSYLDAFFYKIAINKDREYILKWIWREFPA